MSDLCWFNGQEDPRFSIARNVINKNLILGIHALDIFSHMHFLIEHHQLFTISASKALLPQALSLENEHIDLTSAAIAPGQSALGLRFWFFKLHEIIEIRVGKSGRE